MEGDLAAGESGTRDPLKRLVPGLPQEAENPIGRLQGAQEANMNDLPRAHRIASNDVARMFRNHRDWFTAEERVDAHRFADVDTGICAEESSEPAKYVITGSIGAGKSFWLRCWPGGWDAATKTSSTPAASTPELKWRRSIISSRCRTFQRKP